MRWILLLLTICASNVEAQKITFIGIGRMGLCVALCLEKAGYEVLGVDLSPEYIKQINEKSLLSPEPRVDEFLRASTHFRATTSLDEGLEFSDLYFIAVPTNPALTKGEYNCEALNYLLSEINKREVRNKRIVLVSTVSPGYTRNVAVPLLANCPGSLVSYNPLFIAQGDIIKGIQYPEVVLIGEATATMGDELEAIYKEVCFNTPFIGRMSPDSAEISKLALNCFVTMKISFANLVSDIADATPGADKEVILRTIGKDSRVGGKTFFSGYGFGGPCFPRDNRALGDYATNLSIDPLLFRATDLTNQLHADLMAEKFLEMGLAEYLFEDVCYKPNCPVPIIEESQKLVVAKKIAEAGKTVIIQDRKEVIQLVQETYGDLFQYNIIAR